MQSYLKKPWKRRCSDNFNICCVSGNARSPWTFFRICEETKEEIFTLYQVVKDEIRLFGQLFNYKSLISAYQSYSYNLSSIFSILILDRVLYVFY